MGEEGGADSKDQQGGKLVGNVLSGIGWEMYDSMHLSKLIEMTSQRMNFTLCELNKIARMSVDAARNTDCDKYIRT